MRDIKSIQFLLIPNRKQSNRMPIEWSDNIQPMKDYINGAYQYSYTRPSLALCLNKHGNYITVTMSILFWDDLNLTELLTDRQYIQLMKAWSYIESHAQSDIDSVMVYYYPDEDYLADISVCSPINHTIYLPETHQDTLKNILQLGMKILTRSVSL